MADAQNRYQCDLRELRFVLFEQLGLQQVLGEGPFADWGEDEANMVIDETYRFATKVLGPLNATGDRVGCKVEEGRVVTPPGFKEAWKQFFEAGWPALSTDTELGGQGAPNALTAAAEEMFNGSNVAFNMYPSLSRGAADLIGEFGSGRQRKLYVERMLTGEYGGTMCLTEPHAGSDVGASTTKAEPLGDGRYRIKGTKIYISGGDQDFTDTIIHLVLARVEGAVAGTKGLSLFVVPSVRVNEDGSLGESNDVQLAGIEHKMGINGSATCVLNFGENDECIGELMGGVEHKGMRQMFQMMNYARIAVALQGLGLASSAYLNALEYAKDRKQGASLDRLKDPEAPRVPIVQHPNVRQMLMEMKSKVEGTRMLVYKLALHSDLAVVLKEKNPEGAAFHAGQVDLLTPIVKAYASDQAFRICEVAIQVFGGAGYLQDWPVEQYCRDSKIFSIYEGTNSIQALDLVGRKLGADGGAHTKAFMAGVSKFVGEHEGNSDEAFRSSVGQLKRAHDAVGGAAMQFLQWFQQGEAARIPLHAKGFLEMMSVLAVGHMLLDAAAIAQKKLAELPDGDSGRAFYEGKVHSANWFAHNELPGVVAKSKTLSLGDESALRISEAAF